MKSSTNLTYDEVFLLRKSKLIQAYKMMPQTSKEELMVFISVHQMDLVTEYTGKTANQILSSPVLNHAPLFIRKSSDFNHINAAFKSATQSLRVKSCSPCAVSTVGREETETEEDEDRRKYNEAIKDEEAKKAHKSKTEL